MTEVQNRGAALLVREWYDVCGNGPLDTKVLKRILQAELSARDDYEARLVQRLDELQVIADTRLLAMQNAEERADALLDALRPLIRNYAGDRLDADYRDACAVLAKMERG